VVERAVYKPFGEQTEWLSASQPAPESKGWIGERFDADAGLQYLNARYYDPVLGIFIQPDWFDVMEPSVGIRYCCFAPDASMLRQIKQNRPIFLQFENWQTPKHKGKVTHAWLVKR
jgi:RHS repeat-associated protein